MFKKKWSVLFIVVLALLLAACSGGAVQPEQPAATAPVEEQPAEAAPTEAAPVEAAPTEEQPVESEAAPSAPTEEAQAEPAPESSGAAGGTVRIGVAGSPDTLNPGTAVLAESYVLFELVYDQMFDLQLDGSLTPTLAESWDVSDDGKTWTFKIKQGINWHDGQPFTAKDVAFTYNFYRSHDDFPFMSSYGQTFDTVEAPDDSTVVITLPEAIPNMDSRLYAQYILPEHIWAEHSEGAAAAEFENLEMIGTGSFKMAEYQQNEFARLVVNEDYFGGAPKVDELVFQTFGNPDALVQALITGQVDMINEMPSTAVPTLRNNPDITLVIGAPLFPSVRDIFFNLVTPENCPKDDGGVCSGHPALLDLNVRRALAHATDKQNIIDVAMLGLAAPGLTLITDGMGDWYNSSLEDYAFDIAQANQILDDAGYMDSDGDGIREMQDGSRPLDFRLYWPSDVPEAPRIADLLTDTWGQIGVSLQPQALDPDALTTACCPTFDFDIIIWGWSWGVDPDDPLTVYRTSDIPTGNSETGYSNPTFDELYNQQAVELDPEKRRQIVWEAQKITFDDVVYIIPYYQQSVQAFRNDRFTGWVIDQAKVALDDPTSLNLIEPVQ
jgi:peptide/nickel transport system substrate-binding protein